MGVEDGGQATRFFIRVALFSARALTCSLMQVVSRQNTRPPPAAASSALALRTSRRRLSSGIAGGTCHVREVSGPRLALPAHVAVHRKLCSVVQHCAAGEHG